MTAQLLLVIFLMTVGATAYLTYLTVDATITEPLRKTVFTHLRGPAQTQYETEIDHYRERVQNALTADNPIPVDAPHPPPEPWAVQLLSCRWCTGLWISVAVVIAARLALTTPCLPLWHAFPLSGLDLITVPGWVLANAYAVGYLASTEGD